MKQVINISISAATFLFALSIATATGLDIVMQAVILAFCIQWVLFIPAYVFQTEKFYDLSGSITYVTDYLFQHMFFKLKNFMTFLGVLLNNCHLVCHAELR